MRFRALSVCIGTVLAAAVAAGCGGAQAAAAKDPMKCERDPACARARGSYPDCSRQCNYDQECEKRCEEVQRSTDAMGH
jgi:hypothetical protein